MSSGFRKTNGLAQMATRYQPSTPKRKLMGSQQDKKASSWEMAIDRFLKPLANYAS
jgi:hypothetical protein